MTSDKEKKQEEAHSSKKAAHKKNVSLTKEEFEGLSEKARNAEEHRDKWLRCQAELENTKKRLEKEKAEFLKFAHEDLIMRLLPIVDNFDRAIISVKHTEESDAVLKGVKLVQKELHALFRDYGVERVKSVGERFDPHVHEAIAVVETDEHPEDIVIEEIQPGYTLKGRLVRPSIVKVTKNKQ